MDGRVPHALLLEIFYAAGVGTIVEADLNALDPAPAAAYLRKMALLPILTAPDPRLKRSPSRSMRRRRDRASDG